MVGNDIYNNIAKSSEIKIKYRQTYDWGFVTGNPA